MTGVVADTQAIGWYLLAANELSAAAREAMEAALAAGEPIHVPAISLVEIVYLVEERRLAPATLEKLGRVLGDPNSAIRLEPLDLGVIQRLADVPREQVPDMPDRIIAATALHLGLPLVTRDRRIQVEHLQTIW
jgi:PIN domain nuclease of toxin-antitoxin system